MARLNIRKYRLLHGLSQKQLADRSGVSRTWLSQLETKQTPAAIKTIEKLGRGLGIDPHLLIAFDEPKEEE